MPFSEPTITPAPGRVETSTAPAVIEIENLVKTFDGRNVLERVNLTVRRGETLVIMGASGCGKSTLLRCLIGSHAPDEGTVRLFGKDIWALRSRELDSVRRRFGILFQSGALFSSMTVGENVALPLKEHTDLSAEMIDLMVKVKLELVGLREAEDRLPSEISGGMAKRAGLARAIALDPELLFYDEPTSGLDPIMTGIIDGLIVDLSRTMNVTSVVVTHDLKSAFRVADRMVVLNNGRIVLQGLPHEIRASEDPFVKRFIHGPVESRTVVLPRGAVERPGRASSSTPSLARVSGIQRGVPAVVIEPAPMQEMIPAPPSEALPPIEVRPIDDGDDAPIIPAADVDDIVHPENPTILGTTTPLPQTQLLSMDTQRTPSPFLHRSELESRTSDAAPGFGSEDSTEIPAESKTLELPAHPPADGAAPV